MPHSGGGSSSSGGSHSSGGSGGSSSPMRTNEYIPGYHRYAGYHNGRVHYYYRREAYTWDDIGGTSKRNEKKGVIIAIVVSLILTIVFSLRIPSRVTNNGDTSILIKDVIGVLTTDEINSVRSSFLKFQDKTGITPALVVVDNSEWQGRFKNFETYAYNTYILSFDDEKHYLICYSDDGNGNWYIETMVGDELGSVLTTFWEDTLNSTLYKQMIRYGNIADATSSAFDIITNNSNIMDVQFKLRLDMLVFAIVGCVSLVLMSKDEKRTSEEALHSVELQPNVQYVEDTCAYCDGLYVHGMHTECPHCGAPIKPLSNQMN